MKKILLTTILFFIAVYSFSQTKTEEGAQETQNENGGVTTFALPPPPPDDDDDLPKQHWFRDLDGDGFGDPNHELIRSAKPPGYIGNPNDCNDSDYQINPNTIWYRDVDGDGYGNISSKRTSCLQPPGYVRNSDDCNDNSSSINPNTTWYLDGDGDGYAASTRKQCSSPGSSYTRTVHPLGDCNDQNANIHPGTKWYKDTDGDGYASTIKTQCTSPGSGYTRTVKPTGDCNDNNANINPNTTWYKDSDGDGFTSSIKTQCTSPGSGYTTSPKFVGDCDDNNSSLHPNTVWYKDSDGDGYAVSTKKQCTSPGSGYTRTAKPLGDCNDSSAAINPNTKWYKDSDGDGFASTTKTQCTSPGSVYTRIVIPLGDCNDNNASINPDSRWYLDADGDGYVSTVKRQCTSPGANYILTDSPMLDCDDSDVNVYKVATWYKDSDGDGFASTTKTQCANPGSGYTTTVKPLGDCNDSNANINPNTTWYKDSDGDGFTDSIKTQCTSPGSGYTTNTKFTGDCDDNNSSLHPNTVWYKDGDGDGFAVSTKRQCTSPGSGYTRTVIPLGDCNDSNAAIHPNTKWYKDGDGDGFASTTKTQCTSPGSVYTRTVKPLGDCNDNNASINPDSRWYLDADGDGYVTTLKIQCNSPGSNYILTDSPMLDCDDDNVNANEIVKWYLDGDGDGYAVSTKTQCTNPGSGYTRDILPLTDCNDSNGSLNPDTTWYLDADGDGYAVSTKKQCASPGSGYTRTVLPLTDCNDNNSTLNPNTIWYADTDSDGYGDPSTTKSACSQPTGYVANDEDHNDSTDLITNIQPKYFYKDVDGDGFGDPNDRVYRSARPSGYVENNTDQCPAISGGNNGCPYDEASLSNENYVYTRTYQTPMASDAGINENRDVIESVTYFDGLGRPMQQVGIKASPDAKDIVTHIGYDAYGRQDKEWLPYKATGNIGSYRSTDPSGTTQTYYEAHYPEDIVQGAANPYSEKAFEASPLNRVLQQAAPGADWRMSEGNTIDFEYVINSNNEVRRYMAETVVVASDPTSTVVTYEPTLSISSDNNDYYAAGELYKTITYDENHSSGKLHSTEEFMDKQGRVVLKRTYGPSDTNMDGSISANEGEVAHDTYYVYDDYGNLSYVLPPKMNATTASLSTINSNLAALGYQYRYDGRNRLVEKQLPGKGVEYIVYNKLDQPILTQDANQRENDEWLFTKYDAFGRVAYTGIYNNAGTRTAVQTSADNVGVQYEEREATALNLGGGTVYYSNNAYPNTATDMTELLTVNYYDSYVDTDGLSVPGTVKGEATASGIALKGLATVSKVRVLDTNDWITTITGYDVKGRAVYTATTNPYLSTSTIGETKLDFVGKVEESTTTHTRASETVVTTDHFYYDHVGRLSKQTQTLDGVTEVIAVNTYDDLGQLMSKGMGNTEGSNRLQTIDYQYNIRGWLKKINDPSNLSNDLFGFEIKYNDPTGGTALYNGNISQTLWNTQSVNSTTNPVSSQYTYSYDALNRITGATDNTGNYNLSGIAYDQNGNITALQRQGHTMLDSNEMVTDFEVMDKLTYSYDAGNRLLAVTEGTEGHPIYGFKDGNTSGNDYGYDINGNTIQDLNKSIQANGISYNYLNLPVEIKINDSDADKINYIYDASGTKLQKTVTEGGSVTSVTDYAGNYIYENGDLQFFNHVEGYVDVEGMGYKYVYQYKDHLGNVRLSYQDADSNGSIATNEIVEESNYYPFGLKHRGYGPATSSLGNSVAQRWKYNDVELEESLDVNLYEMDFRSYDSALGRFMSVDPVVHFSMSTYAAFDNNPAFWADPSGADALGADGLTNEQWMQLSRPGGGFDAMRAQVRQNFQDEIENERNAVVEGGEMIYSQEVGITKPERKIDLNSSSIDVISASLLWAIYVAKNKPSNLYIKDVLIYKDKTNTSAKFFGSILGYSGENSPKSEVKYINGFYDGFNTELRHDLYLQNTRISHMWTDMFDGMYKIQFMSDLRAIGGGNKTRHYPIYGVYFKDSYANPNDLARFIRYNVFMVQSRTYNPLGVMQLIEMSKNIKE